MLLDQKDLTFKWLRLRMIHAVALAGVTIQILADQVEDAGKAGNAELDAQGVKKKILVLLSAS